ncbi:hypothetical protein ABPG77_009182 [Micractinium sp. CCAP 211/92]
MEAPVYEALAGGLSARRLEAWASGNDPSKKAAAVSAKSQDRPEDRRSAVAAALGALPDDGIVGISELVFSTLAAEVLQVDDADAADALAAVAAARVGLDLLDGYIYKDAEAFDARVIAAMLPA